MAKKKVLITGASGYVAGQMLPTFRECYDLVLLDVSAETRPDQSHPEEERVTGVRIADLTDPDGSQYAHHFEGVDAIVHLAYVRRREKEPIDRFFYEIKNVEMAYNVLRAAYEAGVQRVAVASSNHAADWYEHALIHRRKLEVLDPYELALSDNFYGWAKATYEHLGFLFACGFSEFQDRMGRERHTSVEAAGRKMGVVMVRIGAPRDLPIDEYRDDPATYKRDLGAYISPRDLTQLFMKAIGAPNIDNEHGIPWQVVYGISNNTRAFWSLANARSVLGYQPEDDSEAKYADDIRGFLVGEGATGGVGRVGLS